MDPRPVPPHTPGDVSSPLVIRLGREHANEQARVLIDLKGHTPKSIRTRTTELLAVAAVVGGVGAHEKRSQAQIPRHLQRRIVSARQLDEAADMAERGEPTPGTKAFVALHAAKHHGDFKRANEIVAWIRAQAPLLRDEAKKAERAERDAQLDRQVELRTARLDRADAKRRARAEKRKRDVARSDDER